jgi:hypothetical protein
MEGTTKTKKAAMDEVGTSKGPWTARETGFNCTVIEYKPQEAQQMDEFIGDLERTVQDLFRYGTSQNRDIFATKFMVKIRELKAILEMGRMM